MTHDPVLPLNSLELLRTDPAPLSPVAARFLPEPTRRSRPTPLPHLHAVEAPAVKPRRTLAPAEKPRDYGEGLDWAKVTRLRGEVANKLAERVRAEALPGAGSVSPERERELGRQIISELLEDDVRSSLSLGEDTITPAEQRRLATAIYDAVFRMGRLQPLLEDERIENIEIYGCDVVLLEDQDGRLRRGPRVAETDEELIGFLAFIAQRSEANARSFTESSPRLHLRLDGGERLAAVAWVTPRPQVVIRRHRLRQVTLDDLVKLGTLTPVMAKLLAAAVKAQKSIVVVGEQGAGKTTLVRALCSEIPPYQRIATFETEYELHLHELTDQHKRVLAFEARPGTGERGIDGRQAGEITLADLLIDSFRFNISVNIVGEVRGPEVFAMIKAMQSGTGSISTTHAKSAKLGIDKLVTCALEAGPHVTEAYATRAVASGIDLVVYVSLETSSQRHLGDQEESFRHRYVTEIVGVELGGERGWQTTDIFTPNPNGGPGLPQRLPPSFEDLAQHGFDVAQFNREAGQ